jgi:hypothetical protein
MTQDTQKPLASQALIDYLDGIFPDECPELGETDQKIWFDAGAAQVVRKLKADLKAATTKEEE